MKYLLLSLFLFGCAHTSSDKKITKLEKKIEHLQKQQQELIKGVIRNLRTTDYIEYEMVNIQCFNTLDICNLYSTDKCLYKFEKGEKQEQCLKDTHNACWKKHEACIINNYKKWKQIKKARKEQLKPRAQPKSKVVPKKPNDLRVKPDID